MGLQAWWIKICQHNGVGDIILVKNFSDFVLPYIHYGILKDSIILTSIILNSEILKKKYCNWSNTIIDRKFEYMVLGSHV